MQQELDYSLNLDSRNRFTAWLGSEEITVDMADFAGWLFQTSQIDNYHANGEGLIVVVADHSFFCHPRNLLIEMAGGEYAYTFSQYLKEFGNTAEFDRNLESYLKALKITLKIVKQL